MLKRLKALPKSLQLKVLIVFLGVFILATIFSYNSYLRAKSNIKGEFILRGSQLAWAISLQAGQFFEKGDVKGLSNFLQTFEQTQAIYAVIVYGQKKEVWLESNVLSLSPEEMIMDPGAFKQGIEVKWTDPDQTTQKIALEFLVPVFKMPLKDQPDIKTQSNPIGWLRLMMTRYPFEAALGTLFKRILFNSGLILLAGILLIILVLRRPLKMIPTLSAATDRVAAGQFDFTVPITTQDELGTLVAKFNRMADQLKKTTVSKSYVDNIINSMVDMLLVISPDGTIQKVNPATLKILGYREKELVDKFVKQIFTKDEIFTGEGLEEVFKKGYVRNKELTFLTKSGQTIPVLFSGSVMRDQSREMQGIVCIALDISGLKRAEKEKEFIHEQLIQSQKLESIGKLAGGIAHDFNNLIGSILGFASLIEEELKDNSSETVGKGIKIIKNSAERAGQLTQQLLAFARKGRYEKKRIILSDSIEETINLLERTLKKKIAIKTEISSQLWPIEGDSSQILQVLMNLGINAGDAVSEGGEIRFKCENFDAKEVSGRLGTKLEHGKYVHLSVSDTGKGIPQEIQEKIFEPFFTTKDVGKGTGLGLSMVYGIMQSHHGEIMLTSKEGEGTTFDLYFPALSDESQVDKEQEPQEASSDVSIGKTILVVDDEEAMRELARSILEPRGARVYLAHDGEEACSIYQSHSKEIDLILLDVVMPKKDGLEVFTQIRELNPRMKVIFSSGYGEDEKIAQLRKQETVDFIQKPFRKEQLIKIIQEMII